MRGNENRRDDALRKGLSLVIHAMPRGIYNPLCFRIQAPGRNGKVGGAQQVQAERRLGRLREVS